MGLTLIGLCDKSKVAWKKINKKDQNLKEKSCHGLFMTVGPVLASHLQTVLLIDLYRVKNSLIIINDFLFMHSFPL